MEQDYIPETTRHEPVPYTNERRKFQCKQTRFRRRPSVFKYESQRRRMEELTYRRNLARRINDVSFFYIVCPREIIPTKMKISANFNFFSKTYIRKKNL